MELPLAPGEGSSSALRSNLEIRVLLDRPVVEVYALGGRAVVTWPVRFNASEALGVALVAGQGATNVDFDVWNMSAAIVPEDELFVPAGQQWR